MAKILSAGLIGLLFKLFKIFKSVKVLLAAGTFATYGFIFSWEFSAALISILIIHEYGHIWAMKKCGHKTKGIYLIPFVGGLAVSEDAIKSRWENVFISIAGPMAGFLMTITLLAIYGITGNTFAAQVAIYSALINCFNLLPIIPLDGGHIMKSLAFKADSLFSMITFAAFTILSAIFMFKIGVHLLGLLLFLALLDLVFEWKYRHSSKLTTLSSVEWVVSLVCYVFLISAFIGIMWWGAYSDIPGGDLPLKIMQS